MERPQRPVEARQWSRRAHRAVVVCAIVLTGSQLHLLRDRHAQASPPLSEESEAEAYFVSASRYEAAQREECVELYYQAASSAWRELELSVLPGDEDPEYRDARLVYQRSLARLIATARQYGRLDPRGRLTLKSAAGPRVIPIAYYGFAWQPRDFSQVLLAEDFQRGTMKRYFRSAGVGVSLVGVRHAAQEEAFFRQRQSFPVTAVLRPAGSAPSSAGGVAVPSPGAVLEFYNPCLLETVGIGGTRHRLERDLTASLVYIADEAPRKYLEGFLDPGDTSVRPQLIMMEPYQRGKIPVVFVHGLLSDPTTWLDAVNELRAQRDLYQQYQFWYYSYPTGGAVLESAAKLREQLVIAREMYDPACQDRAMSRIVLLGHSMGGLISKLQVTYSYDILWRHAARQPLEAVRTTPQMRERIRRDFFFDPSPLVARVVFIGTPHHGSTMARRLIGRAASSLARPFGSEMPEYRQLMEDNADIFYDFLQREPPTSIDLLEPSNPLLDAMQAMPVNPRVRLHSIIGTGGSAFSSEPGDGIVPVSSARHPGVVDELYVPARHQQLQRTPETLAQLGRILRVHAAETAP